MKGVPFWDDLFAATSAVPPWGLFKVLAENPEIVTRVPIPLTFLLLPGERIEARLCTGLDHKMLIRRSTVRDLISFETMAQNLKACFDARGSDGQPFVCTIYGEDWRPCFVLSETFNLFILYLRHSSGEIISSSYGPEEQREANTIFPLNICCIQAYLPLESQTRFLAVTLRSSIKTLMEVYRAPHVGKGCFSNSKDTLDSIVPQHTRGENDVYQPRDSNDPDAQLAVRMSASVLSNLRKQCKIRIPGIVCEFVRDIQGDLYLVAVSRCSKPHARILNTPIKPWRPSDAHLARITGHPSMTPFKTRRRSVSVASPGSHAASPIVRVLAESAPKRSLNVRLSLAVDGEERKESQHTAMQTAGPGKFSSCTAKLGLNLAINVNPEKKEEKLIGAPARKGVFLDLDDPHPSEKNLEMEPGGITKGGRVLSSIHEALMEVITPSNSQGARRRGA